MDQEKRRPTYHVTEFDRGFRLWWRRFLRESESLISSWNIFESLSLQKCTVSLIPGCVFI